MNIASLKLGNLEYFRCVIVLFANLTDSVCLRLHLAFLTLPDQSIDTRLVWINLGKLKLIPIALSMDIDLTLTAMEQKVA